MIQSVLPIMGYAKFEIIAATHLISSAGVTVSNLNYSIEEEILVQRD